MVRLRVRLLCSCKFEIKSLSQVASSFVGCQVMDGPPKVKRVADRSAGRMETLEDVLAQVNGEGASSCASSHGRDRGHDVAIRCLVDDRSSPGDIALAPW